MTKLIIARVITVIDYTFAGTDTSTLGYLSLMFAELMYVFLILYSDCPVVPCRGSTGEESVSRALSGISMCPYFLCVSCARVVREKKQ